MIPLPDSPAIEAAAYLDVLPHTDQLGNARPSGEFPDLGAVEALALASVGTGSTDGDSIPDILEGPGGAYPHLDPNSDDTAVDTDGDGSTDAEEIANMTDLYDGNDRFRILSLAPTNEFDAVTKPWVSVTISTFPGLSYHLATDPALEGIQPIPNSGFVALERTTTLWVRLGSGGDFLRAGRGSPPE
jgi:hypothetical protein